MRTNNRAVIDRRFRFAWLIGACSLVAAACGDDGAVRVPEPDAGPVATDSGTELDSGTEVDAGTEIDAGTTPDAGTEIDAGTTTLDAGSAIDGGAAIDGGVPALPITVTAQQTWQWVPFPDSKCRDGSSTGLGVNFNASSNKVLIFFMGGNVCIDQTTCDGLLGQDVTPRKFGPTELNSIQAQLRAKYFDRTNVNNPFKDWNYVFIPYCTGDVHTGTKTQRGFLNNLFHGYLNVGIYLQRVLATFPAPDKVAAVGESAGGFGVAFNYDRLQTAFGSSPVYMIDDSGVPLPDAYMRVCLQNRVRSLWGMNDALPADCVNCRPANGGGLLNFATYLRDKYPNRRLGIISSTGDPTIRTFYNYGYANCPPDGFWTLWQIPRANFQTGLIQVRDTIALTGPFRVFYVNSDNHVVYGAYPTTIQPALQTWISDLINDSPNWANVLTNP